MARLGRRRFLAAVAAFSFTLAPTPTNTAAVERRYDSADNGARKQSPLDQINTWLDVRRY